MQIKTWVSRSTLVDDDNAYLIASNLSDLSESVLCRIQIVESLL
jgi:hypothetical protein